MCQLANPKKVQLSVVPKSLNYMLHLLILNIHWYTTHWYLISLTNVITVFKYTIPISEKYTFCKYVEVIVNIYVSKNHILKELSKYIKNV